MTANTELSDCLGHLMQNYLVVFSGSRVELSVYFVAYHVVNILDFLFNSSILIFLIFCWVSHRDLSHYSVGHLTPNCLDSIYKESWLINPVFYHTSDRRS